MPSKISSIPGVLDIHLYAGDVGDFQINFKDVDQAPVPVNDRVWKAQIRKSRTSIECIDLEMDMAKAPFGSIIVKIPDSVTRSLSEGAWGKNAQWDIQCTDSEGNNNVTVLQGAVFVELDVTR